MVGFAFSIVGVKDGRPTQWSHMMGVVAEHRRSGLGRALKLAQRERALAAGFDLMEWTFDPLQALNAHLNFAKLGVVCDEYVRNLYGESTSALHRGTPTDRFVVQWRLREPHVERRISRAARIHRARPRGGGRAGGERDASEQRPLAAHRHGRSRVSMRAACGSRSRWVSPRCSSRRPISRSSGGITRARSSKHYFGRGYRAVDFELQREGRRGRYLLAR